MSQEDLDWTVALVGGGLAPLEFGPSGLLISVLFGIALAILDLNRV